MSANARQIAIVTGGSRGIGRAITTALLGSGWKVYICSRTASSFETALKALRKKHGDSCAGRVVDARYQAEVDAFVTDILEEEGRIDALVNNAGLGLFGPVDTLSGDDWREVIDTNLSGPFYFLHAVSATMKEQGSGWIFNIASLAGRNPFAGGAAYNASKFGLIGMSEAAMLDLRPHGVRVAAILPGSVDTEFGTRRREADRSWMLRPDDVASMVVHLLAYPPHALPSLVEMRPSNPGK